MGRDILLPQCPNCHKRAAWYYKCKVCGKITCSDCQQDKAALHCPACGTLMGMERMREEETPSEREKRIAKEQKAHDDEAAITRGVLDVTGRALRKAGWKEAETPEEKKKKGCRLWLILLIGFILWLIVGIIMPYLYK